MRRRLASLLLLTAFACDSDDDPGVGLDGGVDASAPTPDAYDPSEELFARDRILEVTLELPEASWDSLRNQTRSILEILTGDCLAQPFPSPFTYFAGTATIDGVTFENVGIRKKGFIGSLSTEKPSLKVKLDEYVAGREHKGVETFTFNNSQQDPSFVRQCVSYDVFAAAGIPAPRCSFAHVTVNGQDLGLFVHVESLNKQFVERHWANDDGNLYEGTLSDFRPEFVNTFELKTNEATGDRSDLQPIVTAAQQPDNQLVAALDPLIDLDGFYTFWATEVLVRHWDGYASNTNNFYMYHDPTSQKFHFIPWGTDGALELNPLLGDPEAPPSSVFATGILTRRLYTNPATQADYVARLEQLLDTIWDEAAILDSIDSMETLIATLASRNNPSFRASVDEVRDAVASRRSEIEGELAGGPPTWTQPLRDPLCLEVLGTLEVGFDTTWGTITRDDVFATGTGTMAATVNGVDAQVTMVGSKSGWNPDSAEPRAAVQIAAQLQDGTFYFVFMDIVPNRFTPGTIENDLFTVFGGVVHWVPGATSFTIVGIFGSGTVTLDEASITDGNAVSGSVSTELVAWPF
jgi:hypothetical protein